MRLSVVTELHTNVRFVIVFDSSTIKLRTMMKKKIGSEAYLNILTSYLYYIY